MSGESILIVDDNVQNLKLVRVLLASEGYDVRTAGDAEEALGELESFSPRLILDGSAVARHGWPRAHAPLEGRSAEALHRDRRPDGLCDEGRRAQGSGGGL